MAGAMFMAGAMEKPMPRQQTMMTKNVRRVLENKDVKVSPFLGLADYGFFLGLLFFSAAVFQYLFSCLLRRASAVWVFLFSRWGFWGHPRKIFS
jgi:hypothetical protein